MLVIRSTTSSQTWNGHFCVQTMGTSQLASAKQKLFEGCAYSPAQCILQLVRDSMADNSNSSATRCTVSLVPDVDTTIRVKDTDICVHSKGQALQVLDDRANESISGFCSEHMWGKSVCHRIYLLALPLPVSPLTSHCITLTDVWCCAALKCAASVLSPAYCLLMSKSKRDDGECYNCKFSKAHSKS